MQSRLFDICSVQPVLDSYGATEPIRQELKLTLPVLAMTVGVIEHERQGCMQSGMDDFIAKPVPPQQLFETLSRYLDRDGAVPSNAAHALQEAVPAMFNPAPLAELVALQEGKLELVGGSLEEAIRQGLGPLDAAHAVWQSGDHVAAAKAMHTLRGGIGSLGGDGSVMVSRQLEQELTTGDDVAIALLIGQARAALQATLDGAQTWLAAASHPDL